MSWDHALFTSINNLQGNAFADAFIRWATELGAVYVAIPLSVLLVRLTGVRGGWPLAWRMIVLGSLTSLLAASLKFVYVRPRPLMTLPDVHVLGPRLYELSFPSGHTITAFCMAALLLALHSRLGAVWFVVACFIGFTRVYVGAHFPTDVLAGAVLGFVPSFILGKALLKDHRYA